MFVDRFFYLKVTDEDYLHNYDHVYQKETVAIILLAEKIEGTYFTYFCQDKFTIRLFLDIWLVYDNTVNPYRRQTYESTDKLIFYCRRISAAMPLKQPHKRVFGQLTNAAYDVKNTFFSLRNFYSYRFLILAWWPAEQELKKLLYSNKTHQNNRWLYCNHFFEADHEHGAFRRCVLVFQKKFSWCYNTLVLKGSKFWHQKNLWSQNFMSYAGKNYSRYSKHHQKITPHNMVRLRYIIGGWGLRDLLQTVTWGF